MTATSRSSLRAHSSKVDTHGEPPDRGGSDAPKIDAIGAPPKKLLPVRRLTRGSQGGRGGGTRSKDGARFPSLSDSIKENKDRKDKAEAKKTREELTDFLDAVSSDDEEAMDTLSDDDDEPMPARKRNDKKASNQFNLLSDDEDDDTTMDTTDNESTMDMETDEPAPDKHPKKVIFRTNADKEKQNWREERTSPERITQFAAEANERAAIRRDISMAKHNARAELKLKQLQDKLATFPPSNRARAPPPAARIPPVRQKSMDFCSKKQQPTSTTNFSTTMPPAPSHKTLGWTLTRIRTSSPTSPTQIQR
jgi:hypothetical protein